MRAINPIITWYQYSKLQTYSFISYVFVFIILIAGLFIPIQSSTTAAAVECDTAFYSGNDILFYDRCGNLDVCSTSVGALTGPAPTQLRGDTNDEKTWNYFIERGLTPVAAAGALGNIEQESGFDPWIGENGSTSINKNAMGVGFGLIQWTNTDGNTQGRRYGVMRHMEDNGLRLDATDPSQNDAALLSQLNWLWDGEYGEMTWQEEVNAETSVDGDPSIRYQDDNTGNGTTLVFHKLVERSADNTQKKQRRIDNAKGFLEKFGNGSNFCSSLTEGGLSEDQAKKLMMNYGENKDNDSVTAMNSGPGKPSMTCPGGPLSNCVSFTAFFANKFTDLRYNNGHGKDTVTRMVAAGAETGTEPRLYAVFSNGFNTEAGHTGIILGIDGDTLIVGHASCSHPGTGRGDGTYEGGGAGFIKVGTIEASALLYTDAPVFAYPKDVDTQAIEAYLRS